MTSTDIDGGCTDEQTPQEALGTICAIVVKVAQESEHCLAEFRQTVDSYAYGNGYRKVGV
jgi:hypothetical protein